jgi:THO complex subunit 1
MLVEAHGKSLAKTVSHTTRPSREKEVDGIDYHFVNTEKFAMMRDGDQFLEHQDDGGIYYGTSRKAIEGLIAQGKTPVLDLGINVSLNFPYSMPY